MLALAQQPDDLEAADGQLFAALGPHAVVRFPEVLLLGLEGLLEGRLRLGLQRDPLVMQLGPFRQFCLHGLHSFLVRFELGSGCLFARSMGGGQSAINLGSVEGEFQVVRAVLQPLPGQ